MARSHARHRARHRRGPVVVGIVVILIATAAVVVIRGGGWRQLGISIGWSNWSAPTASPSPSPPPKTLAQIQDECVAQVVGRMDLQAKVGQLLMLGTPVGDPTSIVEDIRAHRLGGVFLRGRSSQASATLTKSLQTIQLAATESTGMQVHIAIDQEGGQVQTLSGKDFPGIPSAVEQGKWDTLLLRTRTADWARRLAAAGVTMNLAPVADVVPAGTASSNPPIGVLSRHYGSTSDAAAADIFTVVQTMQEVGVMATLKHFPGLGRVKSNTDTSTKAVDNVMTADDPFLRPFQEGIRAGTGAVMISSARYPKLDAESIAAFSTAIITGLLREKLGFTGLIVSDDLGAAVAVSGVAVGERAVRFIGAGGDVVLTVRSSDAGPMAAALIAAAQKATQFEAKVTSAARRVVGTKVRAGMFSCDTIPSP